MATIDITERAMRRLGLVLGPAGASAYGLRVFVDHRCPCGGLKYGMAFSGRNDGDLVQDAFGVPVIVSSDVAAAAGTAEIDFTESPFMSNFVLRNTEHACEWRAF